MFSCENSKQKKALALVNTFETLTFVHLKSLVSNLYDFFFFWEREGEKDDDGLGLIMTGNCKRDQIG